MIFVECVWLAKSKPCGERNCVADSQCNVISCLLRRGKLNPGSRPACLLVGRNTTFSAASEFSNDEVEKPSKLVLLFEGSFQDILTIEPAK